MLRAAALDTVPPETVLAAWNGAYADYPVPLTWDLPRLRAHVEAGSVDASLSRVWLDGEDPVAISLLGVRGDRGWLGGFGVVPDHRRAGLATRALDEQLGVAAGAGLARVGLEVLADNPARGLYERAGFTTTRLLHVLGGVVLAPPGDVDGSATWASVLDDAVRGRLDALLPEPAPWRRQAAHLPDGEVVVGAGDERSPGALLVLRRTSSGWSVLAAGASDEESAAEAVAGLGAGEVRVVDEPEGSPFVPVLLAAGLERTHLQHEMTLTLSRFSPAAARG